MDDFFQDEAGRCRDNAKKATRKDDQELWLTLASRWETMLRTRKREPKVELAVVEHPYTRKPYRAA